MVQKIATAFTAHLFDANEICKKKVSTTKGDIKKQYDQSIIDLEAAQGVISLVTSNILNTEVVIQRYSNIGRLFLRVQKYRLPYDVDHFGEVFIIPQPLFQSLIVLCSQVAFDQVSYANALEFAQERTTFKTTIVYDSGEIVFPHEEDELLKYIQTIKMQAKEDVFKKGFIVAEGDTKTTVFSSFGNLKYYSRLVSTPRKDISYDEVLRDIELEGTIAGRADLLEFICRIRK